MNDLTTRQLELEDMASGMGVSRYNKERPLPWRDKASAKKEETDLVPGKQLMRRVLPRLSEAITEWIEDSASGKAGRKHRAYHYLLNFEADVVAYITARSAINAMARQDKFTKVATTIAGLLEDHARLEEFASGDDAALLSSTLRKLKTSHPGHRTRALRRALREAQVADMDWSEGDKLHVGTKLLEIFIEVTGLARSVLKRKGRKSVYHFEPTEQARDWLNRMHEEQALLSPIYLPMVVPPRDWINPINGGYLSDLMSRRVTMMRTKKKNTIDDLFSTDMPEVYSALNAIQRTPWKINKEVYQTARTLWIEGGGMAGLPGQHDEPLPARPDGIPEGVPISQLNEHDQKRLKLWKASAAEVHADNAKEMSRRFHVAQQLWTAGTFLSDEAIYFPHNLDFRGRIYAVPNAINPQGDDLAKGLLHFSKAKPLGSDGAFWLAVHVANVWGDADKEPLEDRVRWVEQHEDLILDSADNPLDGHRFWLEADGGSSPWQALAAAKEWAGYVRSGRSDYYHSSLPVALDGSCSGLQHFSAMLRDEVGGEAVCHDIYNEVAVKVEAKLKDMDGHARDWVGKVSRKIVKQPCMTFAYSVTSRGMRDQIISALRKLDPAGNYLDGLDYFTGASFLAPLVEEAIKETVIAASSALTWLQGVAGSLAEAGLPVFWSTPVGLPVRQDETTLKTGKQYVWFQGQKLQFRLAQHSDKIDKRRQRSAIAPNFVHSMDAAHLMKTVNASLEAGIDSFSMIHDSFGTHAGDVETMGYLLRREFVIMYGEDILGRFREQALRQLPSASREELPPIPEKGNLDLTGVLKSDFFFA